MTMDESQVRKTPAPRERSAAWRQFHRERARDYQKAYYAKSDKARRAREASNRHRLAKYGVGNDWVDAKVLEQKGCAVCRIAKPKGKNSWHVDHDHATGKVRGVLCGHCNAGLGHFRDKVKTLRAAIYYLEAHEHKQKQLEKLL